MYIRWLRIVSMLYITFSGPIHLQQDGKEPNHMDRKIIDRHSVGQRHYRTTFYVDYFYQQCRMDKILYSAWLGFVSKCPAPLNKHVTVVVKSQWGKWGLFAYESSASFRKPVDNVRKKKPSWGDIDQTSDQWPRLIYHCGYLTSFAMLYWILTWCWCLPPLCVFLPQEIERLKNEKPTWERQVRWEGMRSVFGGKPSLLWINPFAGLRLRRLLATRSRKAGPEFSVWPLTLSAVSYCTAWDNL